MIKKSINTVLAACRTRKLTQLTLRLSEMWLYVMHTCMCQNGTADAIEVRVPPTR